MSEAHCLCLRGEATPCLATGREIGVDVGIASLITTSEGEKEPHPGWYRAAQQKLRVLQRRVAPRSRAVVTAAECHIFIDKQVMSVIVTLVGE